MHHKSNAWDLNSLKKSYGRGSPLSSGEGRPSPYSYSFLAPSAPRSSLLRRLTFPLVYQSWIRHCSKQQRNQYRANATKTSVWKHFPKWFQVWAYISGRFIITCNIWRDNIHVLLCEIVLSVGLFVTYPQSHQECIKFHALCTWGDFYILLAVVSCKARKYF